MQAIYICKVRATASKRKATYLKDATKVVSWSNVMVGAMVVGSSTYMQDDCKQEVHVLMVMR